MQYVSQAGAEICNPQFARKVKEASGVRLDLCYQCLSCSLGCPVAFAMDYLPNEIIRMTQLGLKQLVLTSCTIWLCAGCETCVARCPNGVDTLRVMDTLREIALNEGVKGKETIMPIFHHTFLEGIKQYGKQHELTLLLRLKMRTRDFFSDIGLGLKMFQKGKFKLLPPRIRGLPELKTIFEKSHGVTKGGI